MPWGFAAAGAASGIAGGVASSAGGKKGSKQSTESAALSSEQANAARTARQLAVEQYSRTQGLRNNTIGYLNDFLQNGNVPRFLDLPENVLPTAQLASLSAPAAELQAASTRRSLLNSGMRGGLLQQSLAQAGIQAGAQRAGVLQDLQLNDILRQDTRNMDRTKIAQSLFGAATDLGTGGVTQTQQGLGQTMQGLGGAASNFNSLGAQRIAQNMQTQGALGNMAGKGLGYGLGQTLPAYNSGSLGAQKSGARGVTSSSIPMSAPGGKT